MKRVATVATLLFASAMGYAAAKPCEELKADIAKKLEDKGVKGYTLDIVEKDKDGEGKVVGTCDGGTKKIVYQREAKSPKPEAPAAKKE